MKQFMKMGSRGVARGSKILRFVYATVVTTAVMAWIAPVAHAGYNVTISNAASANGSWNDAGATKIWTPSATGATVSDSEVLARLATAPVQVRTSGGGGAELGDLTVATPIAWSSAQRLTLTADRDILINANLTGSGAPSQLTLTVGSGRNYILGAVVTISLPAGTNFIAGGVTYTVITLLGAEGSVTPTNLQGLAGGLTGSYALGADIDASSTSAWASGAGFAPIGASTGASAFSGRFHGLGHTISGLTINRPAQQYVGLFGVLSSSATTVRDLRVTGGAITGKNAVGVVAGRSAGTISRVVTATPVTVTTADFSQGGGGVVGYHIGSISSSSASGTVTGLEAIGGLVGYQVGGSISNCFATGAVSGSGDNGSIGGLLGFQNSNSSITGSYATGTVNGTGAQGAVGGLVGFNRATIDSSYATGAVGGTTWVGGLVGFDQGGGAITSSYATGAVVASTGSAGGLAGSSSSPITGSHATGNVNGVSIVGGLVGYNLAVITASYATGTAQASVDMAGGLVGLQSGASISNSFALGATSGPTYAGGLIGYQDNAVVSNAYASGNVTGTDYVGGVVGYLRQTGVPPSTLDKIYATGLITGSTNTGGVVGYVSAGGVTNSFWSAAVAGVGAGIGAGTALTGTTNLTLAQLQQQASFAGFNFTPGTGDWRIYENHTSPLLRSFLTPLTLTADNQNVGYDGSNTAIGLVNPAYAPPAPALPLNGIATPYGSAPYQPGAYPPALWSTQLGYDVSTVNGVLTVVAPARPLDVDDSFATGTTYHAMTDGLLVIRSLLGLSGTALTAGAAGPGALRNAAQIQSRLIFLNRLLDIDDNGSVDAATDGVLVTRYLLGFRGSALTGNALGVCPPLRACRATSNGIEAYLATLVP